MGETVEDIVKGLCKYILDNLYEDINMETLEKEFFYSKYYLIRVFKAYTGYTIKEFINTVKVLKSINPLVFTDDTILKIALTNGFNSQEYYSEKFFEILGLSPLKFRKEFQGIDSITNIEELELKKQYLLYLRQFQLQLVGMVSTLEKIGKVKDIKKSCLCR